MIKNVSIVIPAYNEAESIQSVVFDLQNELNKLEYSAKGGPALRWEIIIINDGSSDNTKTV